jgi:uroporphyrinogen III methyltransferase / synthase
MKAGNRQVKTEDKALAGHRILVTREYTADYKSLERQGAELFVFPTIEAVPPENYEELDRAISKLGRYDWLVFTSSNGVHFFLRRLLESGRDIQALHGLRVCAVGPGTAKALKRYGIEADLIPKRFSAEGLVEAFAHSVAGATSLNSISFLFPRAEAARDLFPSKIRELGGMIDEPVAYRTVAPRPKEDLRRSVLGAGITIATFTSGSTFINFLDMVGLDALPFLSRTAIAVIGPVTRQTVEKAGLRVSVMPAKATIKAMVEAIIEWATSPS